MEELETNFILELLPAPRVVLLTPGMLPQLKLFPKLQIPPPVVRLLPPYPVPTVVLVTAARRRKSFSISGHWLLGAETQECLNKVILIF